MCKIVSNSRRRNEAMSNGNFVVVLAAALYLMGCSTANKIIDERAAINQARRICNEEFAETVRLHHYSDAEDMRLWHARYENGIWLTWYGTKESIAGTIVRIRPDGSAVSGCEILAQ